ncbi:acyl-CoA carboxylase epsilon subunit [Streptomyces polyrhachis]|uniref:Acyl-CoA carboxylase epsilon subunit n=1 Tax=Streptomyces polyrhachis TaxID=1282885 RepID=A0ABW2GMI4_9ACTN
MTAPIEAPTMVRVVRGGEIPAEEMAALTAVLLARAAATARDGAPPFAVVPLWERPAPTTPYRSPQSWRN